MDALQLITQCEYFRSLSSEHRQALAQLCLETRIRRGERLFLEGEPLAAVFLLSQGSVQLTKATPDGREVVIKTVEPGEIFAEAALVKGGTYPVTANILRNSVLCEIPKKDFLDLLRHEEFRTDFEAGLITRVRYLTNRILYLTAYEVDERFFLFLRQHYGKRQTYRISLSKKDIANEIGTTPESLSRLIRRLTDQGALTWEDDTLSLRSGIWNEEQEDVRIPSTGRMHLLW